MRDNINLNRAKTIIVKIILSHAIVLNHFRLQLIDIAMLTKCNSHSQNTDFMFYYIHLILKQWGLSYIQHCQLTVIIASMGPTNAHIAPSSVEIQQLKYK